MPVTDQTTSNSSTGNGVTTVFPYTYKILDEADILVEVDGVTKTLTTHYTVSGVGVSGGGNVTFVTAPASGAVVVLSRSMAYSRDTDYQENGDLLAATLDEDVDRVTMLVQQVRQLIRRAVKLPSGVTADQVLGTGNTAAERASKLIGFDSDGDPALFTAADLDPSLVTAFIATLFDDADAAEARTTLGLVIGTNVQAYDADIPTVAASQAEMEAGTEAALRSMSPLLIAQAIAALGATPSSGTFTATLTGCTTAPTADMRYVKSGGVVTMTLDTVRWLDGTSNATTKTFTGMPATLYPSQTRYFIGLSIDNAAPWAACLCSVSTTGVITFTKDLAGNAFTGSGAAYCAPNTITYPI